MESSEQQRQRRGRSGSRASSTSSSLEVRCACQYYRSDSLLPERSALAACRPAARQTAQKMVQTPPAGRRQPVRCGDHEYEPIGEPVMRLAVSQHSIVVRSIAPVVKITDTDVVPVADSDDSIDDRYRFQHGALILDGDVILPLDGRIEDDAMDGRNLGDQTIDTLSADELDSSGHQQLAENVFNGAVGDRNGIDVTLSQHADKNAIPGERGVGLQQRLKSQAGKIRSRFKNIQKPTFHISRSRTKQQKPQKQQKQQPQQFIEQQEQKPQQEQLTEQQQQLTEQQQQQTEQQQQLTEQQQQLTEPQQPLTEQQKISEPELADESSPPPPSASPQPPASPRATQKASRMERFRMALPERPRFSLPDKSKFHLPERPKFNLPDRSKFRIKRPNIQLPKSLHRPRRTPSQRAATQPPSREPSLREMNGSSEVGESKSSSAPRRNIFDFSTLPRPKLFERKQKPAKTEEAAPEISSEYVTSSPKESRAQSIESSTFPRAKKSSLSLSARWAQRFGETVRGFHDESSKEANKESAVDRCRPWRHPSLEEPRLSLKPQTSEEEEEQEEKLPWEDPDRRPSYVAEPPPDEVDEIIYADRDEIKDRSLLYDKEPVKDPRLEDEQLMQRIEREEPKKKVRLVEEDDHDVIDAEEAENEDDTYHPKALYDGSFPPVDPPEFHDERAHSVELSEDEEGSSMRSDREIQQSSGSSCERRRRGVIEEIDSDEFFLREKGISQENMRFHLINEIRDALRPRNEAEEDLPPERPKRTRSARKRRDASLESFEATPSPDKPPYSAQQSFERASSLSSRHRVVYQTESSSRERDELANEPLDDMIVIKPARRKSKSSLGSQSQSRLPIEEQNILMAPIHSTQPPLIQSGVPPVAPSRRKRLRRDQSSSLSIRTVDSALFNGFGDAHSHERIPPTPPPTPPPYDYRQREDDLDYIEPAVPTRPPPPIPPKRTRSRTASLAPEDDRTSHGADSLPGDFGFADEEILPPIPRDSSSREPSLPGYAVIEKREKPPRPPPPRRKKQDKFATAPRPAKTGPKRPLRNYSTLRPARSETIRSSDSMPFIDGDYSLEHEATEEFHRDLRSGEVLIKMQGRPLPAPPRPPRHRRSIHQQQVMSDRRSLPREITPDFSETVASTQTDPLPDDFVIEEEVTTAKLVVAPSRSGSTQVLISTERLPSPASGSYQSAATPPIPPLPTVQSKDTANESKAADKESEHKVPPSEDTKRFDQSQLEILRSALFSTEEPLRIASLEVGDLKVERLTVSQLEAYKVAASEIDAIVVSATEMANRNENEGGIHPSLLQELIAIRNQLEAVTASQSQSRPQSAMEDAYTATSNERVDIPIDEHTKREHDKKSSERKPFVKESSPLLIVQTPLSEQEATVGMGSTVFPLTSSITDLTSTSDSVTVSEATTIVTTEVIEESVITIKPTAKVDESTTNVTSSTTSVTTTTTAAASTPPSTTTIESPTTVTIDEKSIAKTTRSRSSSPNRSNVPDGAVRQTASPVKSLPPVISVTPDSITTPATLDNMPLRHVTSSGVKPQRAVISYRSPEEDASRAASSRETSQSPPPPCPSSQLPSRESSRSPPPPVSASPIPPTTQFIAFPTSHIPPEFFALANPPLTTTGADQLHHHQQQQQQQLEPSIADTAGQLLRALRQAGNRSLRHFVDSIVSRFGGDEEQEPGTAAGEPEQKIRRVELAMCALLVLVACLILVFIFTPRTVTHHHHWDYFNPPQ